jgi:two-component system chemotaxis sensor kinase CheA
VNAKEIIFNQFLVDFMLKNFDALKLGIERLDTNTGQIVGWDARLLLKLLDEFCQQNITSDEKEILSLEMKEKSNTNNSSTEIERKDIRIDVHKLDILNDLIGEMLIARTMMIKEAGVNNSKNAQLKKTFHFFSKVLGELQGTSMSMRMTPVGGLFNKMYRVVHDLVLKTGKEIKIDFYGEKTEMDKSLIESIKDPLLHMVRNAADHGLESTEERISLGKSPQGIIEIGAKNEAGEIWIIVKDNGRGLDSEKLIKKAITSGLLTLQESTQLSSDEIYRLIFTPGFSTASIVTDISGRGVGMDVVMQNIKKLKGRVDIDTKLGVGTTFTIKIPLTLAIIDGMLISTAGIKFTIAIDSIRETIKVSRQAIDTVLTTSKMIKVRNKMIPIIHLANLLGIEKDVKEINDHQFLVIVENAGGLLALLIDELIGQHQTIIKSVPKYFSQNHYLSGCSIQGDGDVGLILDIPSIFESTARDISA